MTRDVLELLLHPVRIRIVRAFSGGRTRTTAELCSRLPDVSQASVYRNVALLTEAGVLQVVDQQAVRGAIERHYRLDRDRARIDHDAAAQMTPEDHRRAFTAAMAALIADFGAYLDTDAANPARDQVAYRQIPLWLTNKEREQLVALLQNGLKSSMDNTPGPHRRHYLLSPILFPISEGNSSH